MRAIELTEGDGEDRKSTNSSISDAILAPSSAAPTPAARESSRRQRSEKYVAAIVRFWVDWTRRLKSPAQPISSPVLMLIKVGTYHMPRVLNRRAVADVAFPPKGKTSRALARHAEERNREERSARQQLIGVPSLSLSLSPVGDGNSTGIDFDGSNCSCPDPEISGNGLDSLILQIAGEFVCHCVVLFLLTDPESSIISRY